MQDRPLTVTVLIPAHNEQATISRCIQAVQASTYPVERIVVAADSCTDRTAELARAAGAEVVLTFEADKAGAQNQVLPTITSDVVVGFDGDTFPQPDCIARMVEAMVAHGYDAVGATVLPVQAAGFFIRARRFAYALGRRWWRISQSKVGRVQVLTGACYAFSTIAIKGIGGFPSVGISADMDATWALHRAGYRLAYIGDAVALTVDPETFADYRKQMQRWAAGYFQTMAKHKRGLLHPKAMLVVWTALLDLALLPVSYALLVRGLLTGATWARWYWVYVVGHAAFNVVLVATVVGWREALLGVGPYTLVNFYNKGLYLWTAFREWVLGRHYGSWTGRHDRPKVIHPMTPARAAGLGTAVAVLGIGLALAFAPAPAPPTPVAAAPAPAQQLPSQPPNTVLHDEQEPGAPPDTQPLPAPSPVAFELQPTPQTEQVAQLQPTTTIRRPAAPAGSPATTIPATVPLTVPPTTAAPTTQPATTPTTSQGSTSTWPSTSAPPSDPPATSTADPVS